MATLRSGIFAVLVAMAASRCMGADEPEFENLLQNNSLQGWVIDGVSDSTAEKAIWTVSDGILRCAGHGFNFLRYDRRLGDFVLRLEYQIFRGGNSGVGVRGLKFDGSYATRPSVVGYELQIADDFGTQPTTKSSGALYRYVAPRVVASRPADQWNQMQLECRGNGIRVVLNGQLVQDVDQSSVAEIKDKPLCGFLSLQCHNHPIEFRQIQLRELKDTPERR